MWIIFRWFFLLLILGLLQLSTCFTRPINIKQQTMTKYQPSLQVAIPLDGNNKDVSFLTPAMPSKQDDCNVGVLLLNLGGPETGDDVEGFLFNLFADPDIIRLPGPLSPLQNVIAYFISKRRAPKSRAAYESIGGGSPILQYSNAQAKLMCDKLLDKYGISAKAYIGMRYWHPFTEEALDLIRKDNINALVIVPLYPQFSISTSGSSLRVLQEEFAKYGNTKYQNLYHTVIPSWYYRKGYVNAMAKLIQNELDSFTIEEITMAKSVKPNLPPKHVLFSAHGVPQSYIEAGDPYQGQIQLCVQKISEKLYETNSKQDLQIHLSYQSRVGPIEWLRPYTDDVLPELGQMGVQNLVVVPISFVSEHIETLEEIDIEYRELAEESGIANWRRCPALNTDESFIEDMADMVMEALIEPVQSVTEVCVANNIGSSYEEALEGVSMTGVGGVGATGDLYQQQQQKSLLQEKERINARVAMAGILLTLLVERLSGQPLTHLLGF